MRVWLIWLAIGFGDYDYLNESNRYFLNYDGKEYWIENIKKEKGALLEKYFIYETESRVDKYDDGRRVKLVSKLGFTLDNIPLYNNRFYNECLEIFLEAEKFLPKAYVILKKNNLNTREIKTCRFSFPKKPVIDEKGYVKFWFQGIWIWGATPLGEETAEVTLGAKNDPESVVIHEYIHMSGHNGDHNKEYLKFCRREILLSSE
jgi:hypothetical protein